MEGGGTRDLNNSPDPQPLLEIHGNQIKVMFGAWRREASIGQEPAGCLESNDMPEHGVPYKIGVRLCNLFLFSFFKNSKVIGFAAAFYYY